MIDILKFIADHSGMNLADALKEAYEQGKRDAQSEQDREFMKLTVKDINGKPYYSIIYLEFGDDGLGHDFEGYASYSLDVISDYLRKYFMPHAQQEIIRCKDCKHLQKWRSKESAKKFGQIYECARNVFDCPKPEDFYSHAEKRTAQSEQNRGEWIPLISTSDRKHHEWCGYQCSICGERTLRLTQCNFCPHCGSYNGGEQDG